MTRQGIPNPAFRGRFPLYLLSSMVLALLLLGHVSPGAYSAAGENNGANAFVVLRFDLAFGSPSSGSLYLYFGSLDPEEMNVTSPVDIHPEYFGNEVLSFVWKEFFGEHADNFTEVVSERRILEDVTEGVLGTGGGMLLSQTNVTFYSNSKDAGVELRTDFGTGVEGGGAEEGGVEYRYLSFLHTGKLAGELSLKDLRARFSRKDYVRMEIAIECDDPLSFSLGDESVDHRRNREGEYFRTTTRYTSFFVTGNTLAVHDSAHRSPGVLFIVFAATLIVGYISMIPIWYKNRFKGRGLVLPVTSILYSAFVWLSYFFPGYALFGGLTYYLICGVFLVLVGLCYFVNPGPAKDTKDYRTMKEEEDRKGEIPELEIPKVTYVRTAIPLPADEDGRSDRQILKVGENASGVEIKKAYLAKMRDYHPDKYENAPALIKKAAKEEAAKVNEAYENLMKALGKKG